MACRPLMLFAVRLRWWLPLWRIIWPCRMFIPNNHTSYITVNVLLMFCQHFITWFPSAEDRRAGSAHRGPLTTRASGQDVSFCGITDNWTTNCNFRDQCSMSTLFSFLSEHLITHICWGFQITVWLISWVHKNCQTMAEKGKHGIGHKRKST